MKKKQLSLHIIKGIDRIFHTDYVIKHHNKRRGFHDAAYTFTAKEIAFVHLPKTGGTTLHTLLEKVAPGLFVNLNQHRPVSLRCPPDKYQYLTGLINGRKRIAYKAITWFRGVSYDN